MTHHSSPLTSCITRKENYSKQKHNCKKMSFHQERLMYQCTSKGGPGLLHQSQEQEGRAEQNVNLSRENEKLQSDFICN